MRQQECNKSEVDPCLLAKINFNGAILISVTIDEFIIAASTAQMKNEFYEMLAAKYTVKRLSRPSEFFGWL